MGRPKNADRRFDTAGHKVLSTRVADRLGISRTLAADILQVFVEEITRALAAGEAVRLQKVGRLHPIWRKAWRHRMPPGAWGDTRLLVEVSAHKTVGFRASYWLMKRMNVGAAVKVTPLEPVDGGVS